VVPIPERRPPASVREKGKGPQELEKGGGSPLQVPPLRYPVWRCTVCGYLCAREEPPLVCPICKAKKDRFERFF
jgi:rubrerythrin